jgi:hypothetical protein
MRALAFGLGQNPKTETQPPQYDSRRPAPTFRLYQAGAASCFAAPYRHELRRGPVRSDNHGGGDIGIETGEPLSATAHGICQCLFLAALLEGAELDDGEAGKALEVTGVQRHHPTRCRAVTPITNPRVRTGGPWPPAHLRCAHLPCDVERHGMYGYISAQPLDKLHVSLSMRLRLGAVSPVHEFGDRHHRQADLGFSLTEARKPEPTPDLYQLQLPRLHHGNSHALHLAVRRLQNFKA